MKLIPVDFHAHINPEISAGDLRELDAVVFAASSSLAEAELSQTRTDAATIWGVGCHPGLVRSQRAFDRQLFEFLIQSTSFVSEVGLDGDSRTTMESQVETLKQVLEVVRHHPRIMSIHSYRATAEVIRLLESYPGPGQILHWWLGTPEETKEAVALGCYFSVNASSVRRSEVLREIPIDRLLTETDHPAGNRFERGDARPGNLVNVERALARQYNTSTAEVREQIWRNFHNLVLATSVESLLPRQVRVMLSAI